MATLSPTNVGGLSSLQKDYINAISNQPSSSKLYDSYRKELGIPDQEKLVSGLDRSILDLEGKIKGVEKNVNERTQGFLVTEAQRSRRVDVEQQPLRDQYLESLRRREGASVSLSGANSLLAQRMQFAQEEARKPLNILEKLIQFETENKKLASANTGFNFNLGQKEQKPTTKPQSSTAAWDMAIERELGGIIGPKPVLIGPPAPTWATSSSTTKPKKGDLVGNIYA